MLNKVLIIGRLTKDPVVRYLPSGSQTTEFSIAYNRRYKVGEEWKEESHFFDVKAYGKLAENLGTKISKGYTVVIEGRLTQDRWTDKEGKAQSRVRIVAEAVRIINKPKLDEAPEEEVLPDSYEHGEEEKLWNSQDDEIPF
ncbi:MAG: single-stranded DNA-binding protein [Hydrogenobacter sp.]|uniref:single-stranded DNA-binding protein n=1 Tax=Hydrogenobacter thermophilus TaxID=940 RepID=UPI0030FA2D9B